MSDFKTHTKSIYEGEHYPCDQCNYKAQLTIILQIILRKSMNGTAIHATSVITRQQISHILKICKVNA